MDALGEIVVSNALLVVILAAVIAVVGRFWKNPQGLHFLWLLVLLKFVTPPLLTDTDSPALTDRLPSHRTLWRYHLLAVTRDFHSMQLWRIRKQKRPILLSDGSRLPVPIDPSMSRRIPRYCGSGF